MNLTHNNPFRILGLPLTASSKEISKQVNTLTTYAEIGKSTALETDFPFLRPVNRTPDVVEQAKKRIQQNENRLLYSLFWFWNNNSVDELALDLLKDGNVEGAIKLWEDAIVANTKEVEGDVYGAGIRVSTKNFSNIKNLSVLLFSLVDGREVLREDYLRRGAALANKYLSSDQIEEHTKLIAGDRFVYDPEKVLHFYIGNVIDSLKEHFLAAQLVKVFWTFPPDAKKYLRTRFLTPRIHRLQREIASASLVRTGSPFSAVDAGKALIENVRGDIDFLQAALGKSDYQYQIVADGLADETIQCGIDYFNKTQNDEPCLPLYEFGVLLAGSKRAQERAKENLDSCLQWIADHPPIRQKSDDDRIVESIDSRIYLILSSAKSAKAKYVLMRDRVIPQLDTIKLEKGQNSQIFVRASNSLARTFKQLSRELDQAKDFTFAHEAIELALMLCRDETLYATINSERAIVNQDIRVVPIRDLCQRAAAMAIDHPEGADQTARWLLNNTRPLLSDLKKVSSNSISAEIHDEVVLAALNCHNLYGQATGDVAGCGEIAELLLPLAVSQTVRSKVTEQIDFASSYLRKTGASKIAQPLANEQDDSEGREQIPAANDKLSAGSFHESQRAKHSIRYPVWYSESYLNAFRAEIAAILSAPELPQHKFSSLVDHIVARVKEITSNCGEQSAESRVVSEAAVNAFREVSSELLRESSTRELALEALQLAASLSSDPTVRIEIERDKVALADYVAEMNLLLHALDPVPSPPTLRSFAGTGLILAGASDYDSKRVSDLTNLFFSVCFVHLLPLARYRVVRRNDGSVTFLGRAKLRGIDHLQILLVILFVVAVAIGLFLALFWSAG